MTSLLDLLDPFLSSDVDLASLGLFLIFLPVFAFFTLRAKAGYTFPLRPIAVFDRLKHLASRAIESGYPIHVAMGSGLIGSEATPEALMGLTVFDYIARHAATCGQPVQGTVADPTLLPAAQGLLRAARKESGFPEQYTPQEVGFYGPEPLAYAAGTLITLDDRRHLANVVIGRFGAEGLWIAEGATREGLSQIGGTVAPEDAALMYSSLKETIIGEEVYAAGAYLHRPSHLGSLAAQDILRIVITLSIIIGVVMATMGYWS